MIRFSVLTGIAAGIALPPLAVAADFSTKDDWFSAAGRIIATYEGSSFTKVTDDFDCQGLSLGVQQKPIQNGGLAELIKAIGKDQALSIVQNAMPRHGATFAQIIELSAAGRFADARLEALKLQGTHGSEKCNDGPKGEGLLASASEELEAWLDTPKVRSAQTVLKHRNANQALSIAYCWKQEFGDSGEPLSFNEFLFHFDFATQAGLAGLTDKSFYRSTNLVRAHETYAKTKRGRIAEQTRYIAQWLRVEWSDAASKLYYKDARKNAEILETHVDHIDYDMIQLLFTRLTRATTGNTPYQMVFMNRGVIDLLGHGRMNSTYYDFRDIIGAVKPLSPSVLSEIGCR